MTQVLPLTKIGFFNPGRLSDEEIEQSFIARIPFFKWILEEVVSEKTDSIPQHHLIIGQRGMGKSSLLFRIAAELRKKPYKDSFIPLSFPEEQYNIDRLSKFWLNCLDALADALDKEQSLSELTLLDTEIGSLSKDKVIDARVVYDIFKRWIDSIKRRPVLLVDNLNLIFSKLNKEEQHQLRATLMSNGAPVLVGASAIVIEETVDYQAPFYDAFQINYLKKLTFQESMEVLINLARITGNANFEDKAYLQKGRLEALYQLTGGTPRTLTIIFPLIQNGFSESIQTDLDALLDVITPLYKARFEELPEQLQVVMDAVALNWDPVNLEQLREITLLENARLSPQLKRLVDVGWLQRLNAYKAKGGAYELSERFFNIWYLMRRSSRRQKRELYSLSKFLESFYGNDLHEFARFRMSCKIENANQIALNSALADALKENVLSDQLRNRSYEELMNLSMKNNDLLKRFFIPTYVTEKKAKELIDAASAQINEGKHQEAEQNYQKAITIDDRSAHLWMDLGNLYQLHLGRYLEAEQAYKKSIELDDTLIFSWYSLGHLYQIHLGKYQEAEQAYNRAIKLGDALAYLWNDLGDLYQNYLSKYQEAEQAYKKAIELDNTLVYSWNGLGDLYQRYLDKYQEAEQAYKKAIELDDKYVYPWNSLGRLYQLRLGRYQEAEQAHKKAIELDNTLAYPYYALGNLYQVCLSRYLEAEQVYKKAIELDSKLTPFIWFSLGELYQNYLSRYQEAEQAYKKAIELDNTLVYSWNGLGDLYQRYLDKYQEAEQAYKKAIELDDDYISSWNSLGNLYQDCLRSYEEAEQAYSMAIKLEPSADLVRYNLVFLWRDKMSKFDEAKELFSTLSISNELKDSYHLNEALFTYYERNVGIAEVHLRSALSVIKDSIPLNTIDDWYRSAAVIIKLGYAESLLRIFSETGYNVILRPFYVAVEALFRKNEVLFLNSIAAEVREPAKVIMEKIENFMR